MVKNACSTLVAFLAEVSKKGMVNWSANSCLRRNRKSNQSGRHMTRNWIADPDLCDGMLDDLLAGQIRLVADKEFVNTLRSIAIDLLQPLFHVGEGIFGVRRGCLL